MSPHQILIVVTRLTAVVWVLSTLSSSYTLFMYMDADDAYGASFGIPITVIAAYMVLKLLVGVALWVFPSFIAHKLLPEHASSKSENPITIQQWQTLGFVLIGIWALSSSIPDALYWFEMHAALRQNGASFTDFDAEQKASVYSTVAEVTIGFFLVFGSKALSGLIHTVRTAGYRN